MPGLCECNLVAEFPYLAAQGIISAVLKTNTPVIKTTTDCVLIGPTLGQLSISAYGTAAVYDCPGKAGASYDWTQKFDCMADKMHFIPKRPDKAFVEGSVADTINMTTVFTTENFSVSAANGPFATYILTTHTDGYDLTYGGPPITVDGRLSGEVALISAVVEGVDSYYLTNFSWEQTPPNVPIVSYEFIFSSSRD